MTPVQAVGQGAQAAGHPPPQRLAAERLGEKTRPLFCRPDPGVVSLQHQLFPSVVVHAWQYSSNPLKIGKQLI